ncbi:MAG: glucose-6-phosphate isomerase [Bacteroidales bacterium]|nr:glucose-6-phosphate isomerase [Bacteroidales bacterium]
METKKLELDFTYALQAGQAVQQVMRGDSAALTAEERQLADELQQAWRTLQGRQGAGNDFLGWIDLPGKTTEAELQAMQARAAELRAKSQAFVCIGIGGSYLGAKAIIEALKPALSLSMPGGPEILYAGHQLSEDYMHELLAYLDGRDYSLCIISKSGTTTEPAIAFRLLRAHLEKKYGKEEARTRIVAITDARKGAMRQLADREGYTTYVVPDDVGGRFSVLTPVGLFPLAVAGIDIQALVKGAAAEAADVAEAGDDWQRNRCLQYACYRQWCYRHGLGVELLVNYDPRLIYMAEWWKQLYGESEGKESKGLFPASVSFTTDLHSMGQYIQQGPRLLCETVLSLAKGRTVVEIPTDAENGDGMNFVAGRRMSYVNAKAEEATCTAHSAEGGVPVLRIVLPTLDEAVLGRLIYFFETACALSGYAMHVNPFDQPGVEAYKKQMFKLLGK